MEMIMITVLDETEEVSKEFLDILLASVKKDNQVSFLLTYKLILLAVYRLKILICLHVLECFTNGLESCGEGSQ